eukprot:g4318.t1
MNSKFSCKAQAALRRETSTQRQRAHKLDLENKRLLASNKHKAMDISALKNALASRDVQLQSMHEKLTNYEGMLTESQETQVQETAEIVYERDELRMLLVSTMERMKEIDQFINKTLTNTSQLEQKLEELQTQRVKCGHIIVRNSESNERLFLLSALQVASKSFSLKNELEKAKKQLSLQGNVIQKVADIQLKRNRKQKEVIKDILDFESPLSKRDISPQMIKDDLRPTLESILG